MNLSLVCLLSVVDVETICEIPLAKRPSMLLLFVRDETSSHYVATRCRVPRYLLPVTAPRRVIDANVFYRTRRLSR
jgi:hypothetical protein